MKECGEMRQEREMTCENCAKHETLACSMACTVYDLTGWKQKWDCNNCKKYPDCDGKTCLDGEWFEAKGREDDAIEFISFDRLNGLLPTIESCTYKLIEELGELLQVIGKNNQMSGEKPRLKTGEGNPLRLIEEAFDVAQSAVTMIYTIADKWGISVEDQRILHEKKLISKGYFVEV
ncbi:hypothetical protein SBF1_50051 [Candidatus Desulfosporosinus infrequens]|uniref:MazG nucleotide pyrophosphohydrolase domain protein n=1 Tax=Candidatus Desulfosporosinus infrequens TaxID=2043169 RepID=A0A2U3LGT3_9FIRM|nr:hypothetical protein SBF1_50051 [Candidatus Desulfosporosinus infrequens]